MSDSPSSSSPASSSAPLTPSTDDLHKSLSEIITGVESQPRSLNSEYDVSGLGPDEITPFPSPSLGKLTIQAEPSDLAILERFVTPEDAEEAKKLKDAANKAFAGSDHQQALKLITSAIQLDPNQTVFWSNRAAIRMKLEEYGGAIVDCAKAIELDEKNVKAFYRRAISQLAILRPTLAVIDFKHVLKLDPKNSLARTQLETTLKLIRRIEFEKAISVGDTETASAQITRLIKDGAVPFEKGSWNGPVPELDEAEGRYKVSKEFVEGMIEEFKRGGKMPKRLVYEIILGCREALVREKSLVDIKIEKGVHCDVVGDTHGQFYDLCNLLSILGPPSENHIILFNGDFVDRGSWSVEVALTLFAYKWLYPNRIGLNRGNHETSDMNKVYGFEGECKAKHGEMTYKLFADVFTALPMASLLEASQPPSSKKSEGSKPAFLSPSQTKRYFVVHGGLFSKDGITLDDVRKIDRFGKQPGQEGLMCELLWTDPQEDEGRGPSKRGVGVGFGPDVTERWCKANGVTAVIRSHEVRQDGYAIEHDGLCLTVFSAPNYCDSTGNKAAYIRMQDDGQLSYHQFESVPHPSIRPMAYAAGFSGMGM